jgi:hypothetical protein
MPKRKREREAPAEHAATSDSVSMSFHSPAASLTMLPPPPPAAAAAPHPAPPPRAPRAPAAQPAKKRARKSAAKKRKTLTTKGRRAVVVNTLASLELEKAGGTPAAAAAAAAAPAGDAALDADATRNLGKAWSKADLAALARLAEEPAAFLAAALPGHHPPPGAELDWERLSRHFGRYSKGGGAVRSQYLSVVRMVREAKREGRKGSNYVELVIAALEELPQRCAYVCWSALSAAASALGWQLLGCGRRCCEVRFGCSPPCAPTSACRQGTVFEVQKVLKARHASSLDKYRVNGRVQWKKAVTSVLHEEGSVFEAGGKTEAGKIIWRLKAPPPQQQPQTSDAGGVCH